KRALKEKLELSAQRKEDQVRQVREKAAVANQNAKAVATRVHSTRKSGEKTPDINAIAGLLTPTFEALKLDDDHSKPLKKRLKKIKQRLDAISVEYAFRPATPKVPVAQKKLVAEVIEGLNNQLYDLQPITETQALRLESRTKAYLEYIDRQSSGDYVFTEICRSGVLERLVKVAAGLELEAADHMPVLSLCVQAIEKSVQNNLVLSYFLQAQSLLPVKVLNLIAKLVPYCSSVRPTAPEMTSICCLLRVMSRSFRFDTIEAATERVIHQLIK
ncbi:hypothetical protein HDU91_001381, partial [Kappamyces sp. JEL0680]